MSAKLLTSMVGRRIRVGITMDQLAEARHGLSSDDQKKLPRRTTCHGQHNAVAGMEGEIVTVHQDAGRSVLYSALINGRIVPLYEDEFDVI